MAQVKGLKDEVDDEDKRLLKAVGINPAEFKTDEIKVGTTRRQPNEAYTTDFIGCGWSFDKNMDGPCVINGTEDEPYKTAEMEIYYEASPLTLTPEGEALPYCDPAGPEIGRGRWVEADPGLNCSYSVRKDQGEKLLFMLASNQTQPEECWIHEQFAKIGEKCHEAGCRVFESSIWQGPLLKPQDDKLAAESMFRYMWQPYTCRVRLYTKTELKTCLKDKHVYIEGDSISDFFIEYAVHRLRDINANGLGANATGCLDQYDAGFKKCNGKVPIRITADDLHIIHRLWDTSEDKWVQRIEDLPESTETHRQIWLSGPFIVSERECHVMAARYKRFADFARPIFERKKWVELNWVNASTALGYESATQFAGLHVVGPPMKILFHQLMGHVCGGPYERI